MSSPGPGSTRGVELADIVRTHAPGWRSRHRLAGVQDRALRAIERCRTGALGGQLLRCEECSQPHYRYHSCRDRHCPKCQTLAKERWLAARRAEVLPVTYFHLVFTLPEAMRPLALGNPRALYALLFRCTAATLLEFGANPRWLGGRLGASLLLHTWTQRLDYHPHIHALVPGGALGQDGRWIAASRQFLFPVQALSKCFRGKFLDGLKTLIDHNRLQLAGSTAALRDPRTRQAWFDRLYRTDWVVYAKPSVAGVEAVLDYLARYTHKSALSNARLLSADSHAVRLLWRDREHGNRKRILRLTPEEFLTRFVRHVLPRGFTRIRHIGFLASRTKGEQLAQLRSAFDLPEPAPVVAESVEAFCLRTLGIDIHRCAHCHRGRLVFVASLAPTITQRPRPP